MLRVVRRRDWSEGGLPLRWEEKELKRERLVALARVERRRKEEGVGREWCVVGLVGWEEEELGLAEGVVVVVVVAGGEKVRWTGEGEKECGEEVRVVEVASAAAADR